MQHAEEIRSQAKQKADKERKKIIDNANREAERIKHQSLSSAKLKAQMLWLERREIILNEVFETVHQRIETISKWSNYNEIVNQLIREAVENLDTKSAYIHADKTTSGVITDVKLQKIGSELQVDLHFGKILSQGVGIIAETDDHRRQFDNTFETRFNRIQESLRSPVYHILMGEAL